MAEPNEEPTRPMQHESIIRKLVQPEWIHLTGAGVNFVATVLYVVTGAWEYGVITGACCVILVFAWVKNAEGSLEV